MGMFPGGYSLIFYLIGMYPPKGRVFAPFSESENGYRLCLSWSEFGYRFWRECMNVFVVSVPKEVRVICKFEVDFKNSFC